MGSGFMYRVFAACILVLSFLHGAAAAADNLLSNGGFEDASDGLPADWEPFVQPQDGASADLDAEVATAGKNSVALVIPEPYEKEPFNNWSQNVLEVTSGQELILKGSIKTEKATEASLWLQCWKREPWSLVKAVSTGSRRRVSGTKDWTPVETNLEVPEGTDYITVRCVLTGKGKAWFDDISLQEEPKPEKEDADEDESSEEAPKTAKLPKKPVKPVSGEEEVSETETRTAKPAPKSSDASVRELINANRVLMEGYEALKETNKTLAGQIKTLQDEVTTLRKQLKEEQAVPTETSAPTVAPATPPSMAAKPEPPAPPLVPSGQNWKGSR